MTDMAKYVKLDDLIRSLYWESDNESWELPEDALERLQKSAVDAVPVVRCGDCFHAMPITIPYVKNRFGETVLNCAICRGDDGYGICDVSIVRPDDFCSDGMKKEDAK